MGEDEGERGRRVEYEMEAEQKAKRAAATEKRRQTLAARKAGKAN